MADSLILVIAVVVLSPPMLLLIGPIAVLITAAMLLIPWHQTMALMSIGTLAMWLSKSYESPLPLNLSDEVVAVLTPILAVAYLPGFIVLLRGATQVLTERHQLTDQLERRLLYEHALANCSQALLASTEGASLSSALTSLLDATDVDAIVVARNVGVDGDLSREIVAIVNRSDSRPFSTTAWERWSEVPGVRDVLKTGQTYFYGDGTSTPAESKVFESAGIESDLVIPIGVNGEWAGYISFTDCSGRAAWTSYDLELLPSVARMIGSHGARLADSAKLQDMITAKDEFVASVSHELRTPLTAVVGFAEELRDGFDVMTSSESKELIELITDQSLEVAHIVEDLLVVTRLGTDSLTLVSSEIDALFEAYQVVRSLGMADVVSVTGEPHGHALADAGRYRQVVRNLLTNARRYGGRLVVIEAAYSADSAVITVKDNGEGVPQERWEQIFEPYERATNSTANPASVGLGLTVSRKLTRLMGGELLYRYRDGWSEFELRLPISSRAGQGLAKTSV